MEASKEKIREMGWALAIDGRRLKILHTTTNQKQAAVMEGTMKGRHDELEVKNKNKIVEFTIFFSARLYYLVKPRDTALGQPLLQRLLGVGWLKTSKLCR
jgi:hypothetical protein